MLSLPFQGRFLPLMQGVSEWQAFPSPEVILLVALHKFATRRSSDIRVIISAYQIEKVSDDHPYI